MKSRIALLSASIVAVGALAPLHATIIFLDEFTTGVSPSWVTDRYEPAGFSAAGGNLEITISNSDATAGRPVAFSDAFYNTQGRQVSAEATGLWTLSGSIFVDSDVLSGTAGGRRADLWGRTANGAGSEPSSDYYIFGYFLNPAPSPVPSVPASAPVTWRIWDKPVGWVTVSTPVTGGWHDLSMSYTGSGIRYKLDGVEVYVDTTLTPDVAHFTKLYAQAYNFGNAASGSYVAKFDNIMLSIPDAGSTLMFLGAGMGSLALLRRKLAASGSQVGLRPGSAELP